MCLYVHVLCVCMSMFYVFVCPCFMCLYVHVLCVCMSMLYVHVFYMDSIVFLGSYNFGVNNLQNKKPMGLDGPLEILHDIIRIFS